MSVSYDTFTKALLDKITEHDLLVMKEPVRTATVDAYMKRAISGFKHICKYDLTTTSDDIIREFEVEVSKEDLDELVDIVSEGMLVQWLKPYVHRQELLENILNTRDFTTYSPAELLLRVGATYKDAQKNYTNMIREYSYNHGNLSDLHL